MPTITPITGPAPIQSNTTQTQSQQSARERAIAMLTGNNSQQTPVQNPSSVAPEEMNHSKPQETGQSDKVDAQAPAEAPKEATKSEEAPLSSQYAQLARKEKQLRAQVNAVKAQEAAIRAREEAIKAKEVEYQSKYIPKDVIAKDPIKVLMDQGYTQDQITQMLLNAPDPAAQAQQAIVEELRAEIRALRDGQESAKKTFEESQTQSYQQAVNQIRNDAKQLVSSDPVYETIAATGAVEDVVELITKTFEKDGIVLSVEEAAAAVEEYLVEEALKVARLKKIQQRLQPPAAAQPPAKQQAAQTAGKTLTSTMGTSRPLSARERAILAFKGEKA